MGKEVLKKDISNKTVVIVLVIVILVSIVSLGVYFNALSNAEPEISLGTQGTVSLNVITPPVKEIADIDEAGGEVGLTVAPPKTEGSTQ